MCNTWHLLLNGQSVTDDEFVTRCRRYGYIDFLLSIFYLWYAIKQAGILQLLSAVLVAMYAFDGICGLYITDPKRVHSHSPRLVHGNTGINVATLIVNIFYSVLGITNGGRTAFDFIFAIVTTVYKTAKCYNLNSLAIRLTGEKGGMLEPLV